MKRIKSLLLSMVMLVSVLPTAGFRAAEDVAAANAPLKVDMAISAVNSIMASGVLKEEISDNPDENGQDKEEVTPQEVIDLLKDAKTDALDAEEAVAPKDIKDLEAEAAAEADNAIQDINNALTIKSDTETDLETYAKDAETAEGVVNSYAEAMKGAKETAEKAAADAEKKESIAENTILIPIADYAAYRAEKDAKTAETAVADAFAERDTAEQNYQKAQTDYNDALTEYETAKKELQDALDQGALDAKAAEDAAFAAKEKVDRLAGILDDAKTAADTAATEAKANLASAQDAFDIAVDNLETAILEVREDIPNVMQETGVAAATGAALAVTKIVTDVADAVVDNLEGNLEELKGQVEELKEEIADAKVAIADAEEELANLNKEDADYPKAESALTAAKAALTEAENIAANADKIVAKRTADLQDSMNNVISGEATDDDIKAVTEHVLKNISYYDEEKEDLIGADATVEIFDKDNKIFKITDGEEVSYYKAEVVGEEGDYYLQYKKVTYTALEDVSDKSSFFSNNNTKADTGYTADGNTVYIDRSRKNSRSSWNYTSYYIEIDSTKYDLVWNGEAWTYTPSGSEQPVAVTLSIGKPSVAKNAVTDSDYVADLWYRADNAETLVKAASEAKDEAQKLRDDALVVYNGKVAEQNKIIEDNQKIVKVEDDYKAAYENLYGDPVEQILVSMFLGGDGNRSLVELYTPDQVENYDKAVAAAAEAEEKYNNASGLRKAAYYLDYLAKTAIVLGYETAAANKSGIDWTEAFKEIGETISNINNVINSVNNPDADPRETIEGVWNLLTTDTLSPNTKAIIASKIEEIVANMHHEAVVTLQANVEADLAKITTAIETVGETGLDLAEKQLVFNVAEAAQTVATALSNEANAEKEAADAAYEAAKTAREQADILKANGVEIDSTKLTEAETAAANAKTAWDQAEKDYEAAQTAATAARISANKARQAARKLRPWSTSITTSSNSASQQSGTSSTRRRTFFSLFF